MAISRLSDIQTVNPYFQFAAVSTATGAATTGTYTDGSGIPWAWWRWTGDGEILFSRGGLVEVAMVGGGGAGSGNGDWVSGNYATGGGGAGGVIFATDVYVPSALNCTIKIGAAGVAAPSGVNQRGYSGGDGGATVFCIGGYTAQMRHLMAVGGGGGRDSSGPGFNGGSGGGSGNYNYAGGLTTTHAGFALSPLQGYNGGLASVVSGAASSPFSGGGGGGAGGEGTRANNSTPAHGGAGVTTTITNATITLGGGGGGGRSSATGAVGGSSVGGAGGKADGTGPSCAGQPAVVSTGSGGGGSTGSGTPGSTASSLILGGNGSAGVFILRVRTG